MERDTVGVTDEDMGLGQAVWAVLAVPFARERQIRRRVWGHPMGSATRRIARALGWLCLWLGYLVAIAAYMAFALPLVVGSVVILALVVIPSFVVISVLTALEPLVPARFRPRRDASDSWADKAPGEQPGERAPEEASPALDVPTTVIS